MTRRGRCDAYGFRLRFPEADRQRAAGHSRVKPGQAEGK